MVDTLPTFEAMRDDLFERALAKHGGNGRAAAREIGVPRAAIYRWLEKKVLADGLISCQQDGAESTRTAHRPARDLPAGEP